MIDSQYVQTTDRGGDHGFESIKLVKGRKRHLLVDTLGFLIAVVVTAASVQERDGTQCLLGVLRQWLARLRCMWADGVSVGFLETWVMLLRHYRKVRWRSSNARTRLRAALFCPSAGWWSGRSAGLESTDA